MKKEEAEKRITDRLHAKWRGASIGRIGGLEFSEILEQTGIDPDQAESVLRGLSKDGVVIRNGHPDFRSDVFVISREHREPEIT